MCCSRVMSLTNMLKRVKFDQSFNTHEQICHSATFVREGFIKLHFKYWNANAYDLYDA